MRLQYDSAAEPADEVMTVQAQEAEPVRSDPSQAVPGRAHKKRKALRQCHTGSATALNRVTELGAGGNGDPPQAAPDCQRANCLSAEGPWPSRQAPPPGDLKAAQLTAVQGTSQRSAHRRCPWPWLLDLQQRARDPDTTLAEPSAGHAVAAAQAAATAAEQRTCAEVGGGKPPGSCTKQHARPAMEGGQPAAARDAGEGDQAPAAARHTRQSPGHAGGTPAAAPSSVPAQRLGRRLKKEGSAEVTPSPAASPSLSLAERMRLAQADDMLQEDCQIPPNQPAQQPQLQCEGMRHSDAAACGLGKQELFGGPSPSEPSGQPSRQCLQVRRQSTPWEAGVQARQAPPRFSENVHGAPLSQQPLLQRLRWKSSSQGAHTETENSLEPLHREGPPARSGDEATLLASQEPLAQRLKRKCGSLEIHQQAGGQPVPGRAGHMLGASVQHIRCQGVEHMAEQHTIADSAPGEHNDWDGQKDQLQTPHLRSAVEVAALEPQSAKSQAGQDASPELHWQRQQPCTHVLQDSSGKPPHGLRHSKRPQQPGWDDSQTDPSAQCAASELGTPLMTHASSAAAAPAPGEASTGLQWRRPLARRPQNDLDMCTPGAPFHFTYVSSYHSNLPV